MTLPSLIESGIAEFDKLSEYVEISRGGRNHTCEAWNGLSDDLEGFCIPDESYTSKIKALIASLATKVHNAALDMAIKRIDDDASIRVDDKEIAVMALSALKV